MNIKGEAKPDEPKSTPEEKQVSEVEEPFGEQKDTPDESKETKEAKEKKSGEGSNEFEDKLKSMESELGRFRQELGEERKRVEELKAYKLWYDQNAAQMQQQVPQQQAQQPNYDEKFFDKPTETFEELSRQREMRLLYQSAFQQAPIAKSMAKMQHPEAFEGIEDTELEQAMYGAVQSGTMNPGILGDPSAWVGTAWILRGPKTGYKIPQAGAAPMNPTQTESPSASSSNEDDEIPPLEGDALTRTLISKLMETGITKEQALKEVQATREMEGR